LGQGRLQLRSTKSFKYRLMKKMGLIKGRKARAKVA